MKINELIDALRVCADENIICPACERYISMKEIGGTADCVDDLLVKAASALEAQQKQIAELEAKLAERETVVISLRKKWQEAEIMICSMCGHFDHKTDGNTVYGNMDCGEIAGYPCCRKFTPWIPVTERLPEFRTPVLIVLRRQNDVFARVGWLHEDGLWSVPTTKKWLSDAVTHWMPLPELPKMDRGVDNA